MHTSSRQRSHRYAAARPEPAQIPAKASSSRPATASPSTVGCSRGSGLPSERSAAAASIRPNCVPGTGLAVWASACSMSPALANGARARRSATTPATSGVETEVAQPTRLSASEQRDRSALGRRELHPGAAAREARERPGRGRRGDRDRLGKRRRDTAASRSPRCRRPRPRARRPRVLERLLLEAGSANARRTGSRSPRQHRGRPRSRSPRRCSC